MNLTIHKWVWNAIAVPNPTQYTDLGKCNIQNKNDIGPKYKNMSKNHICVARGPRVHQVIGECESKRCSVDAVPAHRGSMGPPDDRGLARQGKRH